VGAVAWLNEPRERRAWLDLRDRLATSAQIALHPRAWNPGRRVSAVRSTRLDGSATARTAPDLAAARLCLRECLSHAVGSWGKRAFLAG
jgi:hypothetical protein